jgi:hypothetical protein
MHDEETFAQHARLEELRQEYRSLRKRMKEVEGELGLPPSVEVVDPANPVSLFLSDDEVGFTN